MGQEQGQAQGRGQAQRQEEEGGGDQRQGAPGKRLQQGQAVGATPRFNPYSARGKKTATTAPGGGADADGAQ
jgi:hypothetical protein